MKKLHYALMAILFASFSMVSFTACSSDDDDVPSTEDIKTNIVGMWQTIHVSGWSYDDTEDENLIKVDQDVTGQDSQRILFKGDGTCYLFYYSTYSNKWVAEYGSYTYDVSGNKIIVYYKNIVDQTYTVLSFKNDVVVLQYNMDEGPEYKTNITCKRVD